MDHNLFRQQPKLGRHSYADHYNTDDRNLQSQSWSPLSVINQSTPMVGMQHANYSESHGNSFLSAKRHREQHLIIASSQDDEDSAFSDNHHYDDSMMDCYDDRTGQNKRRRFSYTFPFDNDGQIIHIQQNQEERNCNTNGTSLVEVCTAMSTSSNDKGNPSVEWWREKRPLVVPTSTAAAPDTRTVEQKALSSSSSAMDTSVDDEICCHICQKMFPIPTVPSVRQVMPANALLNYFSPLNKKATSNGDVEIATNNPQRISSSKNWTISPACCRCCDRPSCPECRRQCQVCHQSFCSFCSIARDGAKNNSCFCMDCYDQLR